VSLSWATSRSAAKVWSQLMSPSPISLCWWTGVHAGRINDVPVAEDGAVVVAVGHVDVRQLGRGVGDHGAHVAGAVGQAEGVRDAEADS
jgi:hypothetical protein